MSDEILEQDLPTAGAAGEETEDSSEAVTGETDPETGSQEQAAPKKGIQKRISELVRERNEAERKASYWEGVAAAKGGGVQADEDIPIVASSPKPVAAIQDDIPPRPSRDDFDSIDDYEDAIIDRKLKIKEIEGAKKANDEARKIANVERTTTLSKAIDSLHTGGNAKYEDFGDKMSAKGLVITEDMRDVILASDHSVEVAYFLASNPETARKISKLSPLLQGKELGRIEATFSGDAVPTRTERVATTASPEPLKTVAGKKAEVSKDPNKMTMAEYSKWRESGGGR